MAATNFTRRHFLQLSGSAVLPGSAPLPSTPTRMQTRPIPKTGEQIPCIGLGTWQTFDVSSTEKERTPLSEVLRTFFAAGGRLIDSSPMYGRAEAVTGELLASLGSAVGTPFLATKVWTSGTREGVAQMERSLSRLRTGTRPIDLMQVHNLLDVKTHLPVLREWKQARRIRYLGVTHYSHGAFKELEALLHSEQLDFIQLPYNVTDREVEKRLLPAAASTGTAVLVMRPFDEGELFRKVAGRPLPPFAAELSCTSFAQLFLKFILAHPAVTCPIPATANPKHLLDNMHAGSGRLPTEAERRKLIELVQ